LFPKGDYTSVAAAPPLGTVIRAGCIAAPLFAASVIEDQAHLGYLGPALGGRVCCQPIERCEKPLAVFEHPFREAIRRDSPREV
jgi:hypothetical protein